MDLNKFTSYITSNGGIAKSNRYRVILPSNQIDTTTDLNLLCESTSLPFLQIGTKEMIVGPKPFKIGNQRLTDDVTMTFLLTNTYSIKKYFDRWQKLIVKDNYEVGYHNEYVRDIQIDQLSDNVVYVPKSGPDDGLRGPTNNVDPVALEPKIVYSCVLKNAFPTSVSQIDLNTSNGEAVKLTVQFSYTDWEERKLDTSVQSI